MISGKKKNLSARCIICLESVKFDKFNKVYACNLHLRGIIHGSFLIPNRVNKVHSLRAVNEQGLRSLYEAFRVIYKNSPKFYLSKKQIKNNIPATYLVPVKERKKIC